MAAAVAVDVVVLTAEVAVVQARMMAVVAVVVAVVTARMQWVGENQPKNGVQQRQDLLRVSMWRGTRLSSLCEHEYWPARQAQGRQRQQGGAADEDDLNDASASK